MFMTQAQTDPKKPSTTPLGVAAATAATTPPATPAAGTATTPPATAASTTTPPAASPDATASKKERKASARKVFVVVGQVHEFESAVKAEKFLNGEGAPSEYSVLRGQRIGTNKKVSLR